MMNDKEILAGNKLIAEFMGYEYHTGEGWVHKNNIVHPQVRKVCGGMILARHHRDLEYYNDWNWIMRVAKTIIEIGDPKEMDDYDDFLDIISMHYANIESVQNDLKYCMREEAYISIVDFIEFYNENKRYYE